MNRKIKKLHLSRETVRELSAGALRGAAGGSGTCFSLCPTCEFACTYTCHSYCPSCEFACSAREC